MILKVINYDQFRITIELVNKGESHVDAYDKLAEITSIIALSKGAKVSELKSKCRRRYLVLLRWAVFHQAVINEGIPIVKVAKFFRIDRTAVHYGLTKIKEDYANTTSIITKL